MLRRKQTKTTAILKLAAIKEEIKFVIASIAIFNKRQERKGWNRPKLQIIQAMKTKGEKEVSGFCAKILVIAEQQIKMISSKRKSWPPSTSSSLS
jgi:hypothetical protein